MTKRCLFVTLLILASVTSPSLSRADGGKTSGDGGYSASSGSSHKPLLKGVSLGQASQDETTEAVAHFARARALVIAALHEFDKGRKIASPNELLDSAQWRNTLIDRAEDLDRVLDPQPRATKGGIRFEADPRLLPEADK